MEQPSYYAIIPASVRYDNTLKANEKLLYGEITTLCNKKGCCWATNDYFAKLYEVSKETISRWISDLKNRGYIYLAIDLKTSKRVMMITSIPLDEIINPPLDENVNHNNTSINNIKEINNNKLLFTKKRFKKPTLEEVKNYCQERNNNIDAAKFIDYYESNGWKIGRNPMKDWKACVRNWERNKQTIKMGIQTYQSRRLAEQAKAGEEFLRGER